MFYCCTFFTLTETMQLFEDELWQPPGFTGTVLLRLQHVLQWCTTSNQYVNWGVYWCY